MRFLSLVALCAFVFCPGRARADVAVTTAVGRGADTYIRGGSFADTNFGGEALALFNNAGPDLSQADKVYIRFDVSSLPRPANDQDSLLKLVFPDTGMGDSTPDKLWQYNLWGLKDGPLDFWDEKTITWNNAPGNDPTSAAGMNSDAIALATLPITRSTSATIGGDPIQRMLNTDTNGVITFMISRATIADAMNTYINGIATKENSMFAAPTLSVPEPIAAGICGILFVLEILKPRQRRYRAAVCAD